MITVVIGGSGSGKSDYAESLLDDFKGGKYYVATMQIYDAEMQRKVDRHRLRRKDKGFDTIEQHKNISEIIPAIMESMPEDGAMRKHKAVLIECISNLVANEMFSDEDIKVDTAEQSAKVSKEDSPGAAYKVGVADKILSEIRKVADYVDEFVIVTNNVAEDGIDYDTMTLNYIKTISDVNIGLAQIADKVVEVVVGIPLIVKKERACQ